MNPIRFVLGVLVIGSAAIVGCQDRRPAQRMAAKSPAPLAMTVNRYDAPAWRKKVYEQLGYAIELPGEPRSEFTLDSRNLAKSGNGGFSIDSVKFVDTDLELLTFTLSAPAENYRSLAQFHDTFRPILPTEKNEIPGTVSKQIDVEVGGKKGAELTFPVGAKEARYRMFLADKIYVVAAIGANLASQEAMISRCFNSIEINSHQPQFTTPEGKRLPLAWRKHRGIVERYEIDMPGLPQVKTTPGKMGRFDRTAAVPIHGTDIEFGVNAIRLPPKLRAGTDEQYLALAKLDAEGLFLGGKRDKEKDVIIGGQSALELEFSTQKSPVICRVVRSPSHDYGYEIFVYGADLKDYRADIERFFESFRFTGGNLK